MDNIVWLCKNGSLALGYDQSCKTYFIKTENGIEYYNSLIDATIAGNFAHNQFNK